jgi:predicted short-subunit dehydrogenase-like oxidoreductase (DUF2520 family)
MASQLGSALAALGLTIVEVCNRTPGHGMALAARLGAVFTPEITRVSGDADLYILAVSDSAIASVADSLHLSGRLVVHTAGTIGLDVLKCVSENIGVFYPLQTFSPLHPTGFRNVPICLEASTESGGAQLEELARKLSDVVKFIDSDQRRLLHLAAVFSSNFTNFMYTVAEDLTNTAGIPFDLLTPLINKTAGNAGLGDVFSHQTGPAIREDMPVLERHRALLANNPDYLELYNLISSSIIKYKKSHGKL